jgi:azurin
MTNVLLFIPTALLVFSGWLASSKGDVAAGEITICQSSPAIDYRMVKTSSTDSRITADYQTRTILLEIVPEMMKFAKDTIKVKAGEKINLEIDNLDGMQHNLLITKPGTLEKVGAAADAMLRDPKASEKFYVPAIPEVLFASKMIGPQEIYTLSFTVPLQPGNYPFVCTFPGHWRMMNGILKVEK